LVTTQVHRGKGTEAQSRSGLFRYKIIRKQTFEPSNPGPPFSQLIGSRTWYIKGKWFSKIKQ